MLLQHLENLAKTAYSGAPSNPEESKKMVEEYSKELDADLVIIKKAAASYNQDATAAVNRYQTEYELHLTVWLNALSRTSNTVNTESESSDNAESTDMQGRKRRAENKFRRFREWREKAIKGAQRKFLPRLTPVTELESVKRNLAERENKQRLMKKANSIIRSQKDVNSRLTELLGPGGKEEVARIQQPDEQGQMGFSPHELNNNYANIFRLQRRVKELGRKISLMERKDEEMKEMNGIKLIYNYAADRIRLYFTEKPLAGTLRQLKGNGWHWSPSAGCWQRKITESARKSAESIYKGEIIQEKRPVIIPSTEKVAVKEKVNIVTKKEEKKTEEKKVFKNILVETPKKDIEKIEEPQPAISRPEKKAAFKKGLKKEKVRVEPTKIFRREVKAEPKIEVKVKIEEKPKVIDWSKIAAQVERKKEPEVVVETKYSEPENEQSAIRDYSYEAYAD